ERPGDRRQTMCRRSRNSLRIEIERDLELDMLDIRGAIARPFRFDMVGLKRAAPTRERGAERLAIAKVNRQLIEKSRLMHGADPMNRGRRAQSGKKGLSGSSPLLVRGGATGTRSTRASCNEARGGRGSTAANHYYLKHSSIIQSLC